MIDFAIGTTLIVIGGLTLAAEWRYYRRTAIVLVLCVTIGVGIGLVTARISDATTSNHINPSIEENHP